MTAVAVAPVAAVTFTPVTMVALARMAVMAFARMAMVTFAPVATVTFTWMVTFTCMTMVTRREAIAPIGTAAGTQAARGAWMLPAARRSARAHFVMRAFPKEASASMADVRASAASAPSA